MRQWGAWVTTLVLLGGCGGPLSSSATGPDQTGATPTRASGKAFHHTDPAHDVVRVIEEPYARTQAPANQAADITRVRFTHVPQRVTATVTLRRYAAGYWEMSGPIRTPDDRYGFAARSRPNGGVAVELEHGDGVRQSCGGLSATVSVSRHQIAISVPTRCIARPRWVRMGLTYVWFGAFRDFRGIYVDDALIRGTARGYVLSPPL